MEISPEQRAARDRIAAELAATGLALPGTLTLRAYPCGKRNCRCHTDPAAAHGPYAEWTRKIGGRTVTRRHRPAARRLAAALRQREEAPGTARRTPRTHPRDRRGQRILGTINRQTRTKPCGYRWLNLWAARR